MKTTKITHRIMIDLDGIAELPGVRILNCADAAKFMDKTKKVGYFEGFDKTKKVGYFEGFDPWRGMLMIPKSIRVQVGFSADGMVVANQRLAEWLDNTIQTAHYFGKKEYGFVLWGPAPCVPKYFKTDDGLLLRWSATRQIWTDGDLVFGSDPEGHPVDSNGKWLEGIPVDPNFPKLSGDFRRRLKALEVATRGTATKKGRR